jgi:hypothetical protein
MGSFLDRGSDTGAKAVNLAPTTCSAVLAIALTCIASLQSIHLESVRRSRAAQLVFETVIHRETSWSATTDCTTLTK